MRKRLLRELLFAFLEIIVPFDPATTKLDTQAKTDKVGNSMPCKMKSGIHPEFTRHQAHPWGQAKVDMRTLIVDDRPAAFVYDLIVAPSVHPSAHAQIRPHIFLGEDIIPGQGDIPNGLCFGDGLGIVKQKLPLANDIAAQMKTYLQVVVDPVARLNKKSPSYRQIRIGRKGEVDAHIYFKRLIDSCGSIQSLRLRDDRQDHDQQSDAPL